MKKPNFFIIGAQKAGTTALSEYLRTHPNIFFSSPKEPHFFSSEFKGMCPVKNLDEYLNLFDSADNTALAVGEGSTGYLQSEDAISNIYAFNSTAKIIVMLRNPLALVCSLYSHLLYHGHEDELSFEKAWILQDKRKSGKNLPRDPRLHFSLQYSNVMRLGSQLQKVYEVFAASQVKVIIFDDFIKDTRAVYQSVLNFLDLPDDGRNEFPKINEAKAIRFPSSVNFIRRTMPWPIRHAFNSKAKSYVFRKVFSKEGGRVYCSDVLIKEMKAVAEPEIALLSNILDRDLTEWINWTSR